MTAKEEPLQTPVAAGFVSRFGRSTLGIALLGSALMWLAQPPMMLSLVAWIAPAPWLLFVSRDDFRGWRNYFALWLAGAAYWAAAVYWICLPHPLTPIGLPFLAGYLGCYLPVFVWLSRVGVHRCRIPLWLATPVVWTGLELVQAHLFSGFLMGVLGHTQAWLPDLIQIVEWTGAYGVSFLVMVAAAGLVSGTQSVIASRRGDIVPLQQRLPLGFFAAAIPVAAAIFVGHFSQETANVRYKHSTRATVALIQGDIRATWDPKPDRATRIMQRQAALSRQAVEQAKKEGRVLDLIVWPESMFRTGLVSFDGSFEPPPDATDPRLAEGASAAHRDFEALAADLRTPMLVGIDRYAYAGPFNVEDLSTLKFRVQNSAALVDADGKLLSVYDKTHRVPFGEYMPLFDNMPALYFLTPLPGGVKPGDGPVAMPIKGSGVGGRASGDEDAGASAPLIVSPNICYETVIPHVIHGQVRELTDAGTPPDLMVNVTNNAWFWGSSELEMHLACNIFRVVENRTPMVIAANGGLVGVDRQLRPRPAGERPHDRGGADRRRAARPAVELLHPLRRRLRRGVLDGLRCLGGSPVSRQTQGSQNQTASVKACRSIAKLSASSSTPQSRIKPRRRGCSWSTRACGRRRGSVRKSLS